MCGFVTANLKSDSWAELSYARIFCFKQWQFMEYTPSYGCKLAYISVIWWEIEYASAILTPKKVSQLTTFEFIQSFQNHTILRLFMLCQCHDPQTQCLHASLAYSFVCIVVKCTITLYFMVTIQNKCYPPVLSLFCGYLSSVIQKLLLYFATALLLFHVALVHGKRDIGTLAQCQRRTPQLFMQQFFLFGKKQKCAVTMKLMFRVLDCVFSPYCLCKLLKKNFWRLYIQLIIM